MRRRETFFNTVGQAIRALHFSIQFLSISSIPLASCSVLISDTGFESCSIDTVQRQNREKDLCLTGNKPFSPTQDSTPRVK